MNEIDKALKDMTDAAAAMGRDLTQTGKNHWRTIVEQCKDEIKAIATRAFPAAPGTGVALYRVRRDGDEEMPGMIPKWVEGSPTPADLATFADRGYRVECVYWGAPAKHEVMGGANTAGDVMEVETKEAQAMADSIITDLGLRLFSDADKELMGEFAERIRALVAAKLKGKVPESWFNQEVRARENVAARAMQMEDRLAGIAAQLGVGPKGNEIEARIAGMAAPAGEPGAVELAFDLGFDWRQQLQGHVNDGRDVGRTLTSPQFEQIGVNAGVINALDSKEQAIVAAKAEIKRALAAAPARAATPPATEEAPVSNLPEDVIVWPDLPLHVRTMLQASDGALERVAEAGYNAWCDDHEAWQTVNKMERKRWLGIARASIMELFKDTGATPLPDA